MKCAPLSLYCKAAIKVLRRPRPSVTRSSVFCETCGSSHSRSWLITGDHLFLIPTISGGSTLGLPTRYQMRIFLIKARARSESRGSDIINSREVSKKQGFSSWRNLTSYTELKMQILFPVGNIEYSVAEPLVCSLLS